MRLLPWKRTAELQEQQDIADQMYGKDTVNITEDGQMVFTDPSMGDVSPDMLSSMASMGLAILGFVLVLVLAVYVVQALFMMILLKNIGHPKPWAAWVPFLNTATLYQLAGIEKRWLWVFLPTALSMLGARLEGFGWVVSIVALILSLMVLIWMGKGIQAGLGLESVGGLVLLFFLMPVWMIWMTVRSRKIEYDADAAYDSGQTFPLNRVFAGRGSQAA